MEIATHSMEYIESIFEIYGKYIDVGISILCVILLASGLIYPKFLLSILSVLFITTVYLLVRHEEYNRIVPTVIGWVIGMYIFISTNNLTVAVIIIFVSLYIILSQYIR